VKRFAESLQLTGPWLWGSVGAVVVVGLIFLAAGSAVAALVCFLCAAGIAWLGLSAR
jgi:hypothetical protein